MWVNKFLYYCLLLLLLLYGGLWYVVSATVNWKRTCPLICLCKENKLEGKAVDCAERNLTAVPIGVSSEVQNIYLHYNHISSLPANTFKQAGLTSLINLNMARCQIQDLDEQAFMGLSLLESLDLSENKIQTIHSNTFQETTSLVSLSMDKNAIEILEDGLFTNLTSLKVVSFYHCNIKQIGVKTFDQLPKLSVLVLTGNRLAHISLQSVKSLSGLNALDLHYNPWNCNCRLKDVRDWVVSKLSMDKAPKCVEPQHLRDKLWTEIESSQFKCTPYILYLPGNETDTTISENVTLSCTAFGDHLPEMYWKTPSGEKLVSDVKSTKYSIEDSKTAENNQLVVNLTISNIQTDDAGTYTCVADNFIGEDKHDAYYTPLKLRHTESSNTIIVTSKKTNNTQNNISVVNTKAKLDEKALLKLAKLVSNPLASSNMAV